MHRRLRSYVVLVVLFVASNALRIYPHQRLLYTSLNIHFPNSYFHRQPLSTSLQRKRCLSSSVSGEGCSRDEVSLPQSIQTINRLAIGAVKNILALFYGDRHFARFAALETIARVPYFSYTSVLHLYETFGWFREKEYIKIHFSESWNELHHLLIMEELGGNKYFMDRSIAHIIAFFYYWLVVVLYMIAPAVAYDLNKQVEIHAFETYKAFISSHEHELKNRAAPQSAIDYYENEDPYLIYAFHSDNLNVRKLSNATDISPREKNRPKKLQNLYDVFERICEDEAEHTKTMNILQRDMIIRRQMKRKRLNWPDCK